jgi:hypothetical protein
MSELPQAPGPRIEQFPGERYAAIIPGMEETYMAATQAEFDMLRNEIGIDVPDVTFSTEAGTLDSPQITITTAATDAEPFAPGWEWPAQGSEAAHQDEAVELAEKLLDYYQKALTEKREWFLGAIAGAENHGVTPDGHLTLLNTVPLVISGPAGVFGYSNLKIQLSIMNDWVRNIRFTTYPVREIALRERLRDFRNLMEEF